MRKYIILRWLAISSLIIIAILLSVYARWMPVFPGDLQIILLFQSYSSEWLTVFMIWLSRIFGDGYAALLVILTGSLVWWSLSRLEGFMVGASGLFILVNIIWKAAVNRPRPNPELVQIIGVNHGNGFPSGHSFFAVTFLGFLAYLAIIHLKHRFWRTFSLIVLITLIILVGASRIYLGAHWPSDVLGGYVAGSLCLTILIWGYNRIRISS